MLLRGWRGVSLVNISAVLAPIVFGIFALLAGERWRLLAAFLFAFAIYGCWAIYRGAISKIKILESSILIDGYELKKSEITKFEGRRVSEPSGMDDNECGAELWLIMNDGIEKPVIQMSGYARIESVAEFLNKKLNNE